MWPAAGVCVCVALPPSCLLLVLRSPTREKLAASAAQQARAEIGAWVAEATDLLPFYDGAYIVAAYVCAHIPSVILLPAAAR